MKTHLLFEKYPLNETRETSVGPLPTPYLTYDGHGTFIGGPADLEKVTALIQSEHVVPIRSTTGDAFAGIWAVDFTEASLGPHLELQFSILVSHRPIAPIEDHPLALLKALALNSDARMLCYRLWNSTDKVVAYNTELLGLQAQLTEGSIERSAGQKRFEFRSAAGALLFKGDVREEKRASFKVGRSMLSLFGWRDTFKLARNSVFEATVVNPISDPIPHNWDAPTFLAADAPVVQFFDPMVDQITFGDDPAFDFGLRPTLIEHFEPFRFVYLTPTGVIERG